MQKTSIITTFICLISFTLSAQNYQVEVHQFKASLLITPSLDYEIGIAAKSTLGLKLGTGFAYVGGDFRDDEYGIFLDLSTYYRYYYNFDRRIRKGKNVKRNSANYIGLISTFFNTNPVIGDIKVADDYLLQVGGVYGFQRTYWDRLNLGLDLGIGYAFSDLNGFVVPLLNFNLGYVIW